MEEKLLELLAELCEDDSVKTALDEDLFEAGLLDSLAFADLLFSIEDNFGVIIAPSEVERSDINTPNKIIALVKERLDK
jgi:D-alanine--poly(phosphoribitol) ligase subunit 2